MQHITTIGLDLAKRVFQLHGMDHEGQTVLRKKVRRAQVLKFFATLPHPVPTQAVSSDLTPGGQRLPH
jgi:transposase